MDEITQIVITRDSHQPPLGTLRISIFNDKECVRSMIIDDAAAMEFVLKKTKELKATGLFS